MAVAAKVEVGLLNVSEAVKVAVVTAKTLVAETLVVVALVAVEAAARGMEATAKAVASDVATRVAASRGVVGRVGVVMVVAALEALA